MQMIIGGKHVDAADGKTLDVVNPATQAVIDTVPSATAQDVETALDIAQKGKELWANTPLHERASMLTQFSQLIQEKKNELAAIITKEMGKIIREAEAEVDVITNLFKGYAEKALHLYGITMPPTAEKGLEDDLIFTRREPLGVIGCIIPFNYPVDLFSHKVAPALAAGNAVIVKPSSQNPLVAIRVVELLLECGVPGSVVQIVTGAGATVGNMLASSPKIAAISLTGSTAVGIEIARCAAANLTRVFLELGGNDPLVICDDADIDLAVKEAVISRIQNGGQTCCATKRFIVHRSVKQAFTEKLLERLKGLKIGDPANRSTDVGCLISENAAIDVETQVQHTLRQGAICVYGGQRDKAFFHPTVLTDVTPEMDIARDLEVFGPVFPIIGFETLEEGIKIANNTQYGLQGGVISSDINKAMKVAAYLQCGAVVINGAGLYRSVEMPFGGYKKSGLGREGISYTLEEMTQVKTYVMKKVLQ